MGQSIHMTGISSYTSKISWVISHSLRDGLFAIYFLIFQKIHYGGPIIWFGGRRQALT